MSTPQPRKRLPVNPSIEHLKKQAKRRHKANAALNLSDAQHQLAREYGFRNWAELVGAVEAMSCGGFEPLPDAANRNDLPAVRHILQQGRFTQHDLNLALARAALRFAERREIAELLIKHGADPNGQYGSSFGPIILAPCENLDAGGISLLIRRGAQANVEPVKTKYGMVTPMSAVLSSYVRGRNQDRHRCFDVLRNAGAPVPKEVSPLFLMVLRGDAKALSKLLDQQPDLVHKRFGEMPYGNIVLRGATLLHLAVDYGEIECIDMLLKHGAQVNARGAGDRRHWRTDAGVSRDRLAGGGWEYRSAGVFARTSGEVD